MEKIDTTLIGDSQLLAVANKVNELIDAAAPAVPAPTPTPTPAE